MNELPLSTLAQIDLISLTDTASPYKQKIHTHNERQNRPSNILSFINKTKDDMKAKIETMLYRQLVDRQICTKVATVRKIVQRINKPCSESHIHISFNEYTTSLFLHPYQTLEIIPHAS